MQRSTHAPLRPFLASPTHFPLARTLLLEVVSPLYVAWQCRARYTLRPTLARHIGKTIWRTQNERPFTPVYCCEGSVLTQGTCATCSRPARAHRGNRSVTYTSQYFPRGAPAMETSGKPLGPSLPLPRDIPPVTLSRPLLGRAKLEVGGPLLGKTMIVGYFPLSSYYCFVSSTYRLPLPFTTVI